MAAGLIVPALEGLGAAAAWGYRALQGYRLYQGAKRLEEMSRTGNTVLNEAKPDDCTGRCEDAKKKTRKSKDGKEVISEDRADHILSGDKTGGGHRSGTGKPGKTEFPSGWSDEKILDSVSDVAQNGTDIGSAHRPGEVVRGGTVDGVSIETVVRGDGSVRTGYPTGGPGVVRNPR